MTELPTPSKTEKAVRERLAYHEELAARLRNLIRLLWPRARDDIDEARKHDRSDEDTPGHSARSRLPPEKD